MNELDLYLETLSKRQIDSILSSPSLREGFAEDTAMELNISVKDILTYLEAIEPLQVELKAKQTSNKQRIKTIQLWDLGESYKHRERKGSLMNQIYDTLESTTEGTTMTDVLMQLGKDNGHWRPIAKAIFEYMSARGDIVKIGSEIYLKKRNTYRESGFHRQVFKEVLTHGPISTSAILDNLGYRNKRGYAKIRPILYMMEEEGFITLIDKRWILNE